MNVKAPIPERLKILIADDDPPTRLLLHAAIKQWGFDVIDTKDGQEVWDILQRTDPPHILVLDWLMPKIDGVQLCSKIKKELDFHPYIILLTQLTGTSNIITALESGANEFLSKPFNMAELRSRITVGVRIIEYEQKLANQNKTIEQNSLHLAILSDLESKISFNLSNLIVSSEALEKNPAVIDHINKISVLKDSIHQIMELINEYKVSARG